MRLRSALLLAFTALAVLFSVGCANGGWVERSDGSMCREREADGAKWTECRKWVCKDGLGRYAPCRK